MGDEPTEPDWMKFFSDLRKNASIKAGAIMFGEAQVAYYDVLKQHMPEEVAFNMLAHTTECLIRGVAEATGPLAEALLKATVVWERMGVTQTDKEVPGGN